MYYICYYDVWEVRCRRWRGARCSGAIDGGQISPSQTPSRRWDVKRSARGDDAGHAGTEGLNEAHVGRWAEGRDPGRHRTPVTQRRYLKRYLNGAAAGEAAPPSSAEEEGGAHR